MKKTILILAGLAATVSMMAAEANLNLANKVGTVNAPVTDKLTGAKVEGDYMAMLYWAPLGAPESSLVPAIDVFTDAVKTTSFRTGAAAGYVTAIAVNVKGALSDPQVAIQVQMRAWSKNGGATYEAAYAAATTGGMASSVKLGASTVFTVMPTTPPAVGAPLVGLLPFTVDYIPEPSVLALGLLGGVAFLLRRRS